jgi:hypothetical protein
LYNIPDGSKNPESVQAAVPGEVFCNTAAPKALLGWYFRIKNENPIRLRNTPI